MTRRARTVALVVVALGCGGAAAGCRGQRSEEPPIRPIRHMFQQQRFDPQEGNALFADGRAMRPPVPGTIVAGQPREDDHLYRGLVDGQLATTLPLPLTPQLLGRGRERYGIYCAACHDGAGTGQSVVAQRGLKPPPPSFHDDRLRREPVGHLFQVMTKGVRSMPSYAAQVPPEDRWAIAAYLRALQLSQDAPAAAVPAEVRAARGWQP